MYGLRTSLRIARALRFYQRNPFFHRRANHRRYSLHGIVAIVLVIAWLASRAMAIPATLEVEHSRPAGTYLQVKSSITYLQTPGPYVVFMEIGGSWYELSASTTTSGAINVAQGSWSSNPGPLTFTHQTSSFNYRIGTSYADAMANSATITVPLHEGLEGSVSVVPEQWNWIEFVLPPVEVTIRRDIGMITWNNPIVQDTDGDGIPDDQDPDDDNDGIPDEQDPDHPDYTPPDSDGDGIPDDQDPDDDNDGIPDEDDSDHPDYVPDLDGDGIPDDQDPDRDGDGILNDHDPYPDDPLNLGGDEEEPTDETGDTDGDGITDDQDDDDDNDGTSDQFDPEPKNPAVGGSGGSGNPAPPTDPGDGGTGSINNLTEGNPGLEGTGKPEGDPLGGLKNAAGTFRGKIEGFQLVQAGSLPRATHWTKTLDFGALGTRTWDIDLTAPPIVAFRYALLAVFTIVCGIAFLKRATI